MLLIGLNQDRPVVPDTPDYPFKVPTLSNWLEPDPVWANNGSITGHYYGAVAWMGEVRKPQLSADTPRDVRELFEAGRSIVIYGYLCWPLITLGIGQLFRVSEAALRMKAKALGCEHPKFSVLIGKLERRGVLSAEDAARWRLGAELRNDMSHPKRSSMFGANDVLDILNIIAEQISALFGAEADVTVIGRAE